MILDKYEWVKQQLTNKEELRDSNEKLYYRYLLHIGYNINNSLKQCLKDMESRKIPYLDSIARCSRKVQEENPELRGKLWQKRKSKIEKEVRNEIRKFNG